MFKMIQFFKFILILVFMIQWVYSATTAPKRGIVLAAPKSERNQRIFFPDQEDRESRDDKMESILIRTSHIKSVAEFLELFGIEEGTVRGSGTGYSFVLGNKKESFAEQASCQPELRSVPLQVPQNDTNYVFFPQCVRVPRCGGCCGVSHLLECVATKVSYKDVRMARVRVKRSRSGKASTQATQQVVKVEVHDECKCICKTQGRHCDPIKHRYKAHLCKCECINAQEEVECKKLDSSKFWDANECRCKCRQTKLCSVGLIFRHDSCTCEEDPDYY